MSSSSHLTTSCFSQLPEDLWQPILRLLPLSERLGSCSLVCWRLRRAAAAATEELQLDLSQKDGAVQLQCEQWLSSQWGQHVTSLDLSSLPDAFTQPCPRLRQLKLAQADIRLSSVLDGCAALTSLVVDDCAQQQPQGIAASLAAQTALQHLRIWGCNADETGDELRLPISELVHLTQLTCLALEGLDAELGVVALQHVSLLQRLQELRLKSRSLSLTSNSSSSSEGSLSHLTALQHLGLDVAELDPALLGGCTHLEELTLRRATIVAPAGCMSLLPGLLPQLQQLTELTLSGVKHQQPLAAAACSALVASSKLQRLLLARCGLPAGWCPAVFPPGRQLTSLQDLTVTWWDDSAAWQVDGAEPVDQVDLSRIISCCPALRDLELSVQPGVQLAELAGLAHLTSLAVDGVADCFSLTALIGLKNLHVEFSRNVAAGSVLPLTRLQQLTTLCLNEVTSASWGPTSSCSLYFDQTVPAWPVWLQLLERCATAQECQGGIASELVCSVQQLQWEADQHVQLQWHQAQLQGQQAQLHVHQAQIELQQAQMQVQQAQLAQQQAQLQEQQVQVQQLLQALQQQHRT